jgi:hypothetical protein
MQISVHDRECKVYFQYLAKQPEVVVLETHVSASPETDAATSGAVSAAVPTGPIEKTSSDEKSVSTRISEFLKLLAAAYGIGFAVIMVHTIRLNGPVIEALQFQNIIAGLPVWAVVFGGIWFWPMMKRSIVKESQGKQFLDKWDISLIIFVVISIWPLYSMLKFFVGRMVLGRTLSLSEDVFLLFVTIFLAMLSILVSAYRSQGQLKWKAMLRLSFAYSGLAVMIVGYAIFAYPFLPQSFGGGKPQQVKLYFKDRDVAAVLGGQPSQGAETELSKQVYLYYRTSSFLLVSKAKGQPLTEVPMDQVRSVVWLESRAE